MKFSMFVVILAMLGLTSCGTARQLAGDLNIPDWKIRDLSIDKLRELGGDFNFPAEVPSQAVPTIEWLRGKLALSATLPTTITGNLSDTAVSNGESVTGTATSVNNKTGEVKVTPFTYTYSSATNQWILQ